MKKEKDSRFYDELYRKGGWNLEYTKLPQDSIYYPVWKIIVGNLNPEDVILELGCGAGQLARLIMDAGFNYMAGIDFSQKALGLAEKLNSANAFRFFLGDIYDRKWFNTADYNMIIATEVLEHLQDDCRIIDYIPRGKRVIVSVPNFDSDSHVRHFNSAQDAIDRYAEWVTFECIGEYCPNPTHNRYIYVLKGIRK